LVSIQIENWWCLLVRSSNNWQTDLVKKTIIIFFDLICFCVFFLKDILFFDFKIITMFLNNSNTYKYPLSIHIFKTPHHHNTTQTFTDFNLQQSTGSQRVPVNHRSNRQRRHRQQPPKQRRQRLAAARRRALALLHLLLPLRLRLLLVCFGSVVLFCVYSCIV
jgi:hypothetical protein